MQASYGDAIDLTTRERKPRTRHPNTNNGGYPLRRLFQPAGQRTGTGGGRGTVPRSVNVYRGTYSPDPRDWSWVDWAFILGAVSLWGIVLAGFILLIVRGNKCCV